MLPELSMATAGTPILRASVSSGTGTGAAHALAAGPVSGLPSDSQPPQVPVAALRTLYTTLRSLPGGGNSKFCPSGIWSAATTRSPLAAVAVVIAGASGPPPRKLGPTHPPPGGASDHHASWRPSTANAARRPSASDVIHDAPAG